MGKEIERKFLVDPSHPTLSSALEGSGRAIVQGYLSTKASAVVRVRIRGNQGFLAVKGKNEGLERAEYEYPISLKDDEEMLRLCPVVIRKTRFEIPEGGGISKSMSSGTGTALWPSRNCQALTPRTPCQNGFSWISATIPNTATA